MLPGTLDRRHTSITGTVKAYSAKPARGYSLRVPCRATRRRLEASESKMSDSPPDEARKRRAWQKIQRQLDEALEASFPASDPVAIVTSHEEEDWGIEPAAPAPKPLPPRNP